MGLLDDNYKPRFRPKERYKATDNTKKLSSLKDDCYWCSNPIEECVCSAKQWE